MRSIIIFFVSNLDEAMIESDDSDKDDDFGQAFYAGSGQQVIGSYFSEK